MGNEIKKGYKVVRVYRNEKGRIGYYSAITIFVKRYYTNRYVRRDKDKGALAVFDTLINAKRFLNSFFLDHEERVIFLCEYVDSKYRCLSGDLTEYKGFDDLFYLDPSGTQFAEKVKLLKRIKWGNYN